MFKLYPGKHTEINETFGCDPNCDTNTDGKNTKEFVNYFPISFNLNSIFGEQIKKTCHCSEGPWIRGGRAWGSGAELGLKMKNAWISFYKTGAKFTYFG